MMHHRKKRVSKEKNQRYHAKIRMLQHYGKQITNYDLDRMAEIYRHSEDTIILVKQSNRVRKALIWYRDEAYPIVYDKIRKQIITILKFDYLTENQKDIYTKFKSRMINKSTNINAHLISNNVDLGNVVEDDEVTEINPTEEEIAVGSEEEIEEKTNRELMEEAFERIPNFF